MHITVFGASGRVGRMVVAQALLDGHSITAFVHRANPFHTQDRLTVITGDIFDTAAVERALQDSDAVISTLGSWGTKTKDIVASGVRAIVPVMEATRPKRIITLTGSASVWSGDSLSLFDKVNRAIPKLAAPKILFDGEEHIRLLEASSLGWTVIRSPVMTAKNSRLYRLDNKMAPLYATVPRAAVVQAILDQLSDKKYFKQAPVIH